MIRPGLRSRCRQPLRNGVPVKVVSERLGHADVTVTSALPAPLRCLLDRVRVGSVIVAS
jgi:hypothetical protein